MGRRSGMEGGAGISRRNEEEGLRGMRRRGKDGEEDLERGTR